MQALCPQCNLGKGGDYMKLRSHQEEMKRLVQGVIRNDEDRKNITIDVTPGGGKSKCAMIAVHDLLRSGKADMAIILVPRANLAGQLESDFCDEGSSFFNPTRYQLEYVKGDPSGPIGSIRENGYKGLVMTYHTFADWFECILDLFKAMRLVIVYDECHFLADADKSGWSRACRAAMDVARYNILMSGTLYRQDNNKIPLVEYKTGPDQVDYPVADITYSLRSAIAEKSVIRMEFRTYGGKASYSYDGELRDADIESPPSGEKGMSLNTFLCKEGVAEGMVDEAIDHWWGWRNGAKRARIVVCAYSQKQAEDVAEHIESRHGLSVELAISKLGSKSGEAIKRFRDGHGQVLVTVGMAYIGLDVKDLTHMVFLRNIRFEGYLLQAFARCTRFDPKSKASWEEQWGFIFFPADPDSMKFIEWVRSEQRIGVESRDKNGGGGGGENKVFVPLEAELGAAGYSTIKMDAFGDEAERVRRVREKYPGASAIPTELLMSILRESSEPSPGPKSTAATATKTKPPSQVKKEKKLRVETLARKLDAAAMNIHPLWKKGWTNGRLKKRFGKGRGEMSLPELDAAEAVLVKWSGDVEAFAERRI